MGGPPDASSALDLASEAGHEGRAVRVAHKTGDISTIAHDAGVVYPPNRPPYVIAVLTEWDPDA